MGRGGVFRFALIGAAVSALSGCTWMAAERIPAPEPPQTVEQPVQDTTPTVTPPSAKSVDLSRYYQRVQNNLLTQGLLRGDGGGADTPFTDQMLARNFVRIALFNEYRDDSDFLEPRATLSTLRRWEQPIRMSIRFGDTVPLAQRDMDRASVSAFAARLSRLSGVPITVTDDNPNFHVYFVGEDDRPGFVDDLRQIVPSVSDATMRTISNLPREQYCFVIGTFEPGKSTYRQAVAMIRAEHPNLMRSACIHEELAQGMGLANDSGVARPSIFNDNEEFALLTRHDELLIRILYDERLQAGMSAVAAAPIARQIAREIMAPGPS